MTGPSAAPLPNFDPEQTASAARAAFEEAYRLYLQGARAVMDSFTIPVGLTPKEAVWTLNKTTLYRYKPVRLPEERHPVPLLLVYALINRPYIFDLRPGQSFVEFMVRQGFDVYLLDWGSPGPEDKDTRFDDYAADYLPRAIRKMLRVSGAQAFSLLGYCLGATIAAVYAGLHPAAPLRNLILLTPPLDFSERKGNLFATWFDRQYFDVDQIVDSLGNLPMELILVWAKLLRPVENYVGAYATLWDRLEDEGAVESWQVMHRWTHEGVPFAGEAFRQFIKDFMWANKLVCGTHAIKGRSVNLANIHASLLTIVAQYDHIVPPSSSVSVMDKVSSADKHLEIIPAGHVGIMAGRGARNKLWPKIAEWLGERSG